MIKEIKEKIKEVLRIGRAREFFNLSLSKISLSSKTSHPTRIAKDVK
jgi:hypothetical protein